MIPACPTTGRHSWIMSAANHCFYQRFSPEQAVTEISRRLDRPPHPANEIESAVYKVYRSLESLRKRDKASEIHTRNRWPNESRTKPFSLEFGVADLWEESPVRIQSESATETIIDCLFRGNPLLCVAESVHSFETTLRERIRGRLRFFQHIVPSPMSATTGITQDGKVSAHTLSNTGPRKYAVIEFDSCSTDEQAAALWYLKKYAPLVMVVMSGNKSLHGWFDVEGEKDPLIKNFYRYAVSLGADSSTYCRSQFVRMPDATRDNGNRQSAIYFDPEAIR